MESNKRLSIITINYNNCDGLRKTIESVAGQTYQDYEYIVIDGGSTDGSVEVIKEYADRIDYWVSEKDRGIYHAMNKGAMAAHGEYTLFLNSGDALYKNDVLEKFLGYDVQADIVCGDIINDRGGCVQAPDDVTMEYFLLGSLPHPSSLIRRTLLGIHPYDERFKIAGDWEFFIHHLIIGNVSYQHVSVIVTLFDTTGISCTTGKDEHDAGLRHEAIKAILPMRVIKDYETFMGKKDSYYRLFYTIGKSRLKNWAYFFSVLFLKVLMLNRGWIRKFSLKG